MKKAFFSLLLCSLSLTVLAVSDDAKMQSAMEAFRAKDWATAKALFQDVLRTQPNNNAARTMLKTATENDNKARASARELEKIILPEVKLSEVTVREAFVYISQKIGAARGDNKPFNIVVAASDEALEGKTITLSLTSIPAKDAIEYIAALANLQVAFDQFAVKISQPAQKAQPAKTSP